VRRVFKRILAGMAVLLCLFMALIAYSIYADQQRFRAAANDCERNCIQDSGGLDGCRKVCAKHPNHYDQRDPPDPLHP
jgi:hypothetical protein